MYMYFSLEFRMISLTLFVEYATLKTVAEYYSQLRSEPFIQPIFIDTVRFVSAFFFFPLGDVPRLGFTLFAGSLWERGVVLLSVS